MYMCVGKKNAMSAEKLCEWLGYGNTRTLRNLRQAHNAAASTFHHKILSDKNGYWIVEASSPEAAHKQYQNVAWRKIKQGVAMIKEGRELLKSIQLDQTTRLKLTKYMKETVQIFVDNEEQE